MEQLACIFSPIECAQNALMGIPVGYYIIGSFLVGLLVGAITRWAGIATAVVLVIAWMFGKRRFEEPIQHDLPYPDGLPPVKKPKSKTPIKKRKTLQDLLRGMHDGG